jgi:DNA-binding CsgD family transcriptional regulator
VRFDEWELTSSERDVALLSFRGMKTAEIAAARGTRVGTVKAQLSSVFHKAGVSTKSEFLALFMDAFLDLGAADATKDGWSEDLDVEVAAPQGIDGEDEVTTA